MNPERRIHPARIEEVVEKGDAGARGNMLEEGEKAAFELGLPGLAKEALYHVGKLRYRSSTGEHPFAQQGGGQPRRHHGGRAAARPNARQEGGGCCTTSARESVWRERGRTPSWAPRWPASRRVGQGGHIIASTISTRSRRASRPCSFRSPTHFGLQPGARRESLDTYVKRLENLEAIASGFKGVDKATPSRPGASFGCWSPTRWSRRAGRDTGARDRAEDRFRAQIPGIVRVTVIRETRIVEYAK